MKFGLDYRIQQLNQFQQNSLEPAFQFSNQMSAINPLNLNSNSGVALASFLMGYMQRARPSVRASASPTGANTSASFSRMTGRSAANSP